MKLTPKTWTMLREGHYGLGDLRADTLAGLTVAIVALPLSMAIAIASGLTPDQGLITAIVGGLLVSGLGGSRFQIGGPAGAFIVLVAATVDARGVDGLLLTTMLSGAILLVAGALRLGVLIQYIPHAVTVGFSAGIAAIIGASQLRDLFGLTLAGKEPGALIPKLTALAGAVPTVNPWAALLGLGSVALIVGIRRVRPGYPAYLIAVAVASVIALGLPVETLGTRFGSIARSFPAPALPPMSWPLVWTLLPGAASFAMLGGIESLLSAVVADTLTGRHHRSSAELVAQGVANLVSPLFGGSPVTGTIARTATNVRAGARSPLAGILHAVFLLVFILVAAPAAGFIPLAALAGLLLVVAWGMADLASFGRLLRATWGDAAVVSATFLLVVLRDLPSGIIAGCVVAAALSARRWLPRPS